MGRFGNIMKKITVRDMNRRDLKDLTRMERKMVNGLGTTKMVQ